MQCLLQNSGNTSRLIAPGKRVRTKLSTMRIISSFHDYYDSAHSPDVDRSVVFERYPISQFFKIYQAPAIWRELAEHEQATLDRFPANGDDIMFMPFYACVAGRIHPGLSFDRAGGSRPVLSTFYDARGAYESIRSHPVERMRQGPRTLFSERPLSARLESFFEPPTARPLLAQLAADRTPIAIFRHARFGDSSLAINCELEVFEFFKVMDAWTAFSAIDAFLADPWGNLPAEQ